MRQGLQACLRGTFFTNAHGFKLDCGEASAAMLVSLVRDLKPECHAVATPPPPPTAFVLCVATMASGPQAGARFDLGTTLISTGIAFAALTPDAQPLHLPYSVAQQVAQRSHAGLWQFADTPDPNAIILRSLQSPALPSK